MKIRSTVFLFIVVTAALITLMLWHGKKQSMETPPTSAVETNAAPTAATISNTPVYANISSASLFTNAPPQSKWEQLQPVLDTQNDQPIVFYGKVEDQFGNLIADAQIAADVRIYNGVQHTVERLSQKSNADGLFTISGYKGERLGLNVRKKGYVLVSINGSTIYSKLWPENQRAHPDPNNPIVIKMWKLQGAEPLVSINQHYKLNCINAPINFDLIAGKIVSAGGDITITVNRPVGEISERNRQDWGFEIKAVDGGVMEATNTGLIYTAPEDGYEPSNVLIASSNRHGIELIQQAFFIKSRNGQIYSKLDLSFDINSVPDDFMNITFKGFANTNSSRNWEATAPQ